VGLIQRRFRINQQAIKVKHDRFDHKYHQLCLFCFHHNGRARSRLQPIGSRFYQPIILYWQ
ncbi:hypothetical protein MXD81_11635, partial [Microbacteriaceae bacterium K1510]|nr:hypothetical protein [Microbacteriaceae bacterium K1510]